MREIAELMRIKSSNTIFTHLKALEKKGYLEKNRHGRITSVSPERSPFEIPLYLETIPAGIQAPADDTQQDLTTIDQYVIRRPYNTFALRVRGNSMEKAGRLPGDIILVEKNPEPLSGQIVVAHLPDGFTVKRYIEEDGKRLLRAESSEEYQIDLAEGTEFWGTVIGSIRKFV